MTDFYVKFPSSTISGVTHSLLKVSSAYDVSNFQNIDRSVISGQEILSNFIIESFIYWQKVPLKSFSFPEISKKKWAHQGKV